MVKIVVTKRKVLSRGTHICNIKVLSLKFFSFGSKDI